VVTRERLSFPALGARALAGLAAAAAAGVLLAGMLEASAGDPPAAPGAGFGARAATGATRALVKRAQALVDVRPADLGYRLVVSGPRAGVRGQTDTTLRTITLYVDARDATHRVAHDLAHEIGHAYDARRLGAAQRSAWLRARGAPAASWFPAQAGSDYASGAGDFAEVFARCHAASPEFRGRLAPRPADACALLPAEARADAMTRR
jgi:hypothetical protein